MSLPHCETLLLEPVEGVLRITLNLSLIHI